MKNPDVLIYVQKIRKYLESSEEAKKYFLTDIDIEKFLEKVYNVSENNFNTSGDPILSPLQMDEIKIELSSNGDNSIPSYFNFSMN